MSIHGVITATPDADNKFYLNQLFKLTATFTATDQTSKIPEGAFLNFVDADNSLVVTNGNKQNLVIIDPEKPYIGQVVYYCYFSKKPAPSKVITTVIVADNNFIDASSKYMDFNNIKDAVNIDYYDPMLHCLPVAETDNELPTNKVNSIHYTATVTDDEGKPVKDYLDEWAQDWDSDLFSNMLVYNHEKDKTCLETNIDGRNSCITVTDVNGIAEIYLVSKTNQVYFEIRALGSQREPFSFTPVIVYDVNQFNSALQEPDLITSITNNDGSADLDSVEGSFVSVQIYTSNLSDTTTSDILLFVNGNLNKRMLYSPQATSDKPFTLNFNVAKVSLYTDHGPNSNEDNIIYYVLATKATGVMTSMSLYKKATGNVGENKPDPDITRELTKPSILYAGDFVNLNTIKNGLIVVIPISSPASVWQASVYDKVTATIYLNGWDPTTGQPKHDMYSSDKDVTQDDIDSGNLNIIFPAYQVTGYDSAPGDQNRQENLYVEFYIIKKGAPDNSKIMSQYNTYRLDTSAPGG